VLDGFGKKYDGTFTEIGEWKDGKIIQTKSKVKGKK
jgi:hypothetical protein